MEEIESRNVLVSDETMEMTRHEISEDTENSLEILDNSDLPDSLLVCNTSSAAET